MLGAVRWVVADFGPLLMFWALDLSFGLKLAIGGSVAFILGDGVWRWWRGLAFTRIYMLTSVLTVVFGGVDLLSATPFMLKYEAVITNTFTGFAFIAGARGSRPLIMELAEKRQGVAFPARPDVIRFFQLFTLLWATYFFIKAGFYLSVAALMPMTQAMLVRSAVGSASMAVMVAVSVTQGRRLFRLCQWMGLLPSMVE